MPTDPTPLAQRLVEAASDAMCESSCGGSSREDVACAPDDWTPEAQAAVVAVLRELADDFTNPDGEWIAIPPPVLLRLADSIEKGEG